MKFSNFNVGANGVVQLCYVTFELGNLHEAERRRARNRTLQKVLDVALGR